MLLSCPRPQPELQVWTSRKFPKTNQQRQWKFSLAVVRIKHVNIFQFWLTDVFFLGIRKGAMLSPSTFAGLAFHSWVSWPPDCLLTSLDNSTWIAWRKKSGHDVKKQLSVDLMLQRRHETFPIVKKVRLQFYKCPAGESRGLKHKTLYSFEL